LNFGRILDIIDVMYMTLHFKRFEKDIVAKFWNFLKKIQRFIFSCPVGYKNGNRNVGMRSLIILLSHKNIFLSVLIL